MKLSILILICCTLSIAFGQTAVQPPINEHIPINPPIAIEVPNHPIPIAPPITHLPIGDPHIEVIININGVRTDYSEQNLVSITINNPSNSPNQPISPVEEFHPIIGGVDFISNSQTNEQPIHGGVGIIRNVQEIQGADYVAVNNLNIEDTPTRDNQKFTPY